MNYKTLSIDLLIDKLTNKLYIPIPDHMIPEKNQAKHEIESLFYNRELMELAYDLLINNGYKVVKITKDNYKKDCNVEYHRYYSETKDQKLMSEFGRHIDNYGATSYRVNTIIFYLSHTFEKGGELNIYEDDFENTPIESINVRENNVVLLRGDTWHDISPCIGIGERTCIVIQIREAEN